MFHTVQARLRILHKRVGWNVSCASDGRRPTTSHVSSLSSVFILRIVLGVHWRHISLGTALLFVSLYSYMEIICAALNENNNKKYFIIIVILKEKTKEAIILIEIISRNWSLRRGRVLSALAYRILLRTSSGSGGFGRRVRHIAKQPATMIDAIMIPAASTNAARIIVCDSSYCLWRIIFLFFWFDVSAGVGSSEIIVSSWNEKELEIGN